MTQESFRLSQKQREALAVIGGEATHILGEGGSRSGKTLLFCRALATRAIAAPGSRHVILREHFNHVKTSIVLDTWPKMMSLCFPGVHAHVDRSDWYAKFENESEVWFGGLDDKERTEKILGKEYATIYLNEIPQISYASRNIALTRLAQKTFWQDAHGAQHQLRLKSYNDSNPPSKAHWSYRLWHEKKDPDTGRKLPNPDQYAFFRLNPRDNSENLPKEYLQMLENMPVRMRMRFLDGLYAEVAPGALWTVEMIDRWRFVSGELPEMQRIVVAVDPSGSGDTDNQDNDAIGIVVVGLGVDGNGYLLEDLTLKAGPATWGKVATSAFERHQANTIVAETNYGGEMVRFVVQTARPNTPCKKITASRGKVPRADPIAALHEQGKIRFVGNFPELEDEICAFTTTGYTGEKSPNRADAFVWGMSELFPGLTKVEDKPKAADEHNEYHGENAWLS